MMNLTQAVVVAVVAVVGLVAAPAAHASPASVGAARATPLGAAGTDATSIVAAGGFAKSPALATGLHAPDVGPLLRGVVAEGVKVAVYAGCWLALDDNDTCIDIAGRARDDVTTASASAGR